MKLARADINKNKRYWHKAFLGGLLLATLIFLPFLILDNGLFLYYGDFNVQQIPFYQMIHDTIRSGNFGWSHTTDLGANIIGSYSFYLFGSPFFWLTIPFPSEAVPYLMAPLLILKSGCAALSAYIFLRRYVQNKNLAVIGGLLYAFSGFAIYNVFFNHFHEAIIIFPLLLASVDEYMATRRRGILTLTVFAACVFNYYFFTGQVVFVIIYWFLRYFTGSFGKISLKDFIRMAFEILLGFAATAFILLPSVLVVMQNPRVDNAPGGWSALLYPSNQKYVHILQSLFFPPDIPARPNFTPDSNAKWASVAAYIPLFSMTGVIAYLQTKKHTSWIKRMIVILLVMAFVPILNSMFQLLNASFYARWYYMLVLVMVLATLKSVESVKTDWRRAITWTGSITLAMLVAIGFMPVTETDSETNLETTTYGLMDYPERFWAYGAIALVSLGVLALLLALYKRDKKKFIKYTYVAVGVITVFYSVYLLALGKSQGDSAHGFLIPYVINKGDNFDLPDKDSVRTDVYKSLDNLPMFWQIPTIQAFNSVVPGSIMEFYPTVGVTRDVASRPETSVYGLRSFTSTKYLLDYKCDGDNFLTENDNTKMPGWKKLTEINNYDVYENEYYIPMGFTYDKFISEEAYYDCSESRRHLLLLKAMVLSDEQIIKYADITNGAADTSDFSYTIADYYNDCEERKEVSCTDFAYDNNGFSAKIDMRGKNDNLVFLSVPYEEGWSAQVNGQNTEIEKVNIGFMAVRVKGGQIHNIRFNYETPGLKTGLIITGISFIVFALYLLFFRGKRVKAKKVNKYIVVKRFKAEKMPAAKKTDTNIRERIYTDGEENTDIDISNYTDE